MTDYSSTPTDALRRFAAHSDRQVEWWRRELDMQNENVARARRALDRWTRDRDEQFHALDERDELAPGWDIQPTD
jgi:hypothetical protein